MYFIWRSVTCFREGGLKAAYVALQAATKAASEDLSGWAGGSGVSDVESRIFFLAFAQTQCGAGRRLNRSLLYVPISVSKSALLRWQ